MQVDIAKEVGQSLCYNRPVETGSRQLREQKCAVVHAGFRLCVLFLENV